jgi:hypothetical protein
VLRHWIGVFSNESYTAEIYERGRNGSPFSIQTLGRGNESKESVVEHK